jgi:hypothetical protein
VKVLLIAAGVLAALFGYYVWSSQPAWYPERYGLK